MARKNRVSYAPNVEKVILHSLVRRQTSTSSYSSFVGGDLEQVAELAQRYRERAKPGKNDGSWLIRLPAQEAKNFMAMAIAGKGGGKKPAAAVDLVIYRKGDTDTYELVSIKAYPLTPKKVKGGMV